MKKLFIKDNGRQVDRPKYEVFYYKDGAVLEEEFIFATHSLEVVLAFVERYEDKK